MTDGTRDCLQTERVRHVAQCCIPGTARKNWRNVLGSTAYFESKDNRNKSMLLSAPKEAFDLLLCESTASLRQCE